MTITNTDMLSCCQQEESQKCLMQDIMSEISVLMAIG